MHRARGYSCHTCHQCALRASRHRAFSHRAFSHRAFSQQQCHQSVCCWGGSSQGLAQPDYTVAPAAAAASSTTAPPGAPSTPLPCGSAPHHQQTTPTLQLGAPPMPTSKAHRKGVSAPTSIAWQVTASRWFMMRVISLNITRMYCARAGTCRTDAWQRRNMLSTRMGSCVCP